MSTTQQQLDQIERWAAEDAAARSNVTSSSAAASRDGKVDRMTTKPCANELCGQNPWSWGERKPRAMVEQPARGRPRLYCSDACKMVAHRAKKSAELAEAEKHARAQARYDLDRRRAQLAEQRSREVENVVALALAAIPSNSRVSTTQRKALCEQVTRSLELAGLIQEHPQLARLDVEQFYRDPRVS